MSPHNSYPRMETKLDQKAVFEREVIQGEQTYSTVIGPNSPDSPDIRPTILESPESPPDYAPAEDTANDFNLDYTNSVSTLYQSINRECQFWTYCSGGDSAWRYLSREYFGTELLGQRIRDIEVEYGQRMIILCQQAEEAIRQEAE